MYTYILLMYLCTLQSESEEVAGDSTNCAVTRKRSSFGSRTRVGRCVLRAPFLIGKKYTATITTITTITSTHTHTFNRIPAQAVERNSNTNIELNFRKLPLFCLFFSFTFKPSSLLSVPNERTTNIYV